MNDSIFCKPIVIHKDGHITHYYGSIFAVLADGYKSRSVLNVCEGKQKTHKGKTFAFLEDFGKVGEMYLKRIREEVKE